MEPGDPQRTTMPGQTPSGQAPGPGDPRYTGRPGPSSVGTEPVVVRRMDPRLWALLPLIALCILGAYMFGKSMNKPAPAEQPVPPPQPVVAPQPAKPPTGKITVTEVPTQVTPPPPAPAPVETPPPAPAPPKPMKPKAYQHVEPPVVLPPPPATTDDNAPPIVSPEPPSTGAPDNSNPDETPRPQSDVDRDPVKMNDPALEYPESAYEQGVEGTVRVNFTITADGTVEDPQVVQSSGDSRLDRAAATYVTRLRFRPAIRNGQPSSVRANRTVRFTLH